QDAAAIVHRMDARVAAKYPAARAGRHDEVGPEVQEIDADVRAAEDVAFDRNPQGAASGVRRDDTALPPINHTGARRYRDVRACVRRRDAGATETDYRSRSGNQ